jgi:hypothetical protein
MPKDQHWLGCHLCLCVLLQLSACLPWDPETFQDIAVGCGCDMFFYLKASICHDLSEVFVDISWGSGDQLSLSGAA